MATGKKKKAAHGSNVSGAVKREHLVKVLGTVAGKLTAFEAAAIAAVIMSARQRLEKEGPDRESPSGFLMGRMIFFLASEIADRTLGANPAKSERLALIGGTIDRAMRTVADELRDPKARAKTTREIERCLRGIANANGLN